MFSFICLLLLCFIFSLPDFFSFFLHFLASTFSSFFYSVHPSYLIPFSPFSLCGVRWTGIVTVSHTLYNLITSFHTHQLLFSYFFLFPRRHLRFLFL
jgi:hypothetical protein